VRSLPSHILFDLDGTLADSSQGILSSFHATLKEIDINASDEQLRRLIGPPLGESFRHLGVVDEDIDDVVALYREFYASRGVREARLYNDVAATLEGLTHRGVRLGVATAKRVDFARQMLSSLGVAHYFDDVAGASVDLRITSKFDIMSQVLHRWGVGDSLDVWMVGDRHFDMVAARAHGVLAVGVLWGFGSASELRDAGAHWLIERPRELLGDEVNGGSPVCLLDEVCDVCGGIVDDAHPQRCPGTSGVTTAS
jgi:phosphoglycolate phosphatase